MSWNTSKLMVLSIFLATLSSYYCLRGGCNGPSISISLPDENNIIINCIAPTCPCLRNICKILKNGIQLPHDVIDDRVIAHTAKRFQTVDWLQYECKCGNETTKLIFWQRFVACTIRQYHTDSLFCVFTWPRHTKAKAYKVYIDGRLPTVCDYHFKWTSCEWNHFRGSVVDLENILDSPWVTRRPPIFNYGTTTCVHFNEANITYLKDNPVVNYVTLVPLSLRQAKTLYLKGEVTSLGDVCFIAPLLGSTTYDMYLWFPKKKRQNIDYVDMYHDYFRTPPDPSKFLRCGYYLSPEKDLHVFFEPQDAYDKIYDPSLNNRVYIEDRTSETPAQVYGTNSAVFRDWDNNKSQSVFIRNQNADGISARRNILNVPILSHASQYQVKSIQYYNQSNTLKIEAPPNRKDILKYYIFVCQDPGNSSQVCDDRFSIKSVMGVESVSELIQLNKPLPLTSKVGVAVEYKSNKYGGGIKWISTAMQGQEAGKGVQIYIIIGIFVLLGLMYLVFKQLYAMSQITVVLPHMPDAFGQPTSLQSSPCIQEREVYWGTVSPERIFPNLTCAESCDVLPADHIEMSSLKSNSGDLQSSDAAPESETGRKSEPTSCVTFCSVEPDPSIPSNSEDTSYTTI